MENIRYIPPTLPITGSGGGGGMVVVAVVVVVVVVMGEEWWLDGKHRRRPLRGALRNLFFFFDAISNSLYGSEY